MVMLVRIARWADAPKACSAAVFHRGGELRGAMDGVASRATV